MTTRTAVVTWAADIPPERPFPRETWGPWTLDARTYELVFTQDSPYVRYALDLESCTTSAEVLDWIMQVSGKSWADDAVLAGAVRALNGLLSPQSTLCSWGKSLTRTRRGIRDEIRSYTERSAR